MLVPRSSVASKAAILQSMDSTPLRKRLGGMGACCTGGVANLALKRYVLSTIKGNGKSKMNWIGAAVYVVPLFKETAHWLIVTRMNATFLTTESSCINPALR